MVLSSAIGPGVTGILIDLERAYPLQIDAMGLYCLVMTIAMALLAGASGAAVHGACRRRRTGDRPRRRPHRSAAAIEP